MTKIGAITSKIQLTKASKKEQKKLKRQSKKQEIKNTVIANLAQTGVAMAALPINLFAVKMLPQASLKLSDANKALVNKAAERVVNEVTNLGEKGVVINHVNPTINITRFPDKVLELLNPIYATRQGTNAFFVSACENSSQAKKLESSGIKLNAVNINKDKLPLVSFHELGHAFNYHNSKFWKAMQNTREPFMYLASTIALLPALLKKQKAEEGKELTPIQKINNFVRKIAPALSSLLLVPMTLEEGMASFRGNNWAKQLLDSNLAKQVKKTNAWGFATYVTYAAVIGIAAFTGGKVRDYLDEKNAQNNYVKNKSNTEIAMHQG